MHVKMIINKMYYETLVPIKGCKAEEIIVYSEERIH